MERETMSAPGRLEAEVSRPHRVRAASRRERPAASPSLAERAYEVLKMRILTLDLQPGSVVVADNIAAELGMSVTPVHDALKRLCAEGLAQVVLRTGYVISAVTLDDVQEVFGLRLLLEPFAAELGVRRASDRDRAAFQAAAYEPLAPLVSPDGREPTVVERFHHAGEHHDRFHVAVAALSGQRRLVGMVRDLLEQGRRLRFMSAVAIPATSALPSEAPYVPPGAHLKIANAVMAGDADGAADAMAEHVRESHRRVVAAVSSLPESHRSGTRRLPGSP